MADRQYRYAQIIIDISQEKLDRPFTYRIPDGLADQVEPGSRVRVPFGHTVRTGYVIELTDSCDLPADKIREIGEVLLPEQGYSREKDSGFYIRLAGWMKERYGATTITALKTVLTSRRTGSPKVRRQIRLLLDRSAAEEKLAFYHRKHQVARERLLRELIGTPVQPYDLITTRLHVGAPVIRAMKQAGVIEVESYTDLRNPVSVSPDAGEQKTLSPAQQRISDEVVESFEAGRPGVTLIRGITGSGKTEVYISIISRICRSGRQAIMLIPEIALTYQTLLRFYRHFGDRVSVINSSLSESEKADQWERARRGEIDVIIGPRSALFTPFERLGVIVMDEEHENSYKNESMPKYHARETAIQIARMRGACVVLGSATPSMESYYRALRGEYRLFTLDERLTGGSLPCTEIADMRMELRRGNRGILSRSLDSLIRDRLARGEQTMLFLNRRGFAGSVSCRSCGFVVKCPHCDVPMSLHRGGRMVCHYCGHQAPQPKTCPECGSPYISPFRAGTQQIETWLQEHFPGARILRMDADTTARKGSYEKILSAFANEEADILLGTQMSVKGHDFPNVTLVGILLADLSLYANDYRAAERTFQLLTQAAGRAGRGTRPGQVVIQTYKPDHYAIRLAARQDYEAFYEEEIRYRSLLGYPPAGQMLAVQIQSRDEDAAMLTAGRIRDLLQQRAVPASLIGPTAALIGKLRDNYRFVIYVKDAKYDTLIHCKDIIEAHLRTEDLPARDLQVQFDFNPVVPY